MFDAKDVNTLPLFKVRWTFCTDLMRLWVFLIGQEKDQRSLDLNTAKCMLGLLLGKTWPLFPVFNQFLEVSKHTVVVSKIV